MSHIVPQNLREKGVFLESIDEGGLGVQKNPSGYGSGETSEIRTITSTVRCRKECDAVGRTTDTAIGRVVGGID